MRRLGLLALVLFLALCALAQETKKTDHKPAAKKEAAAPAMPMPKPSPEMQKLSKMIVGAWDVSMKMEPAPEMGMPNGMTGKGKGVTRLGPGGLSVVSDFTSSWMGGFHGHGVTWWDPNDHAFHTVWCDSMTPMGCELAGTGKFDGDTMVMEYVSKATGQPMQMKETMAPSGPDSYTFDFEMGPVGGTLKPSMHFVYKKAGSPVPVKVKPGE